MITNTTAPSAEGNEGRKVYGVEHNFQQYFSYIVVVSFIGGGKEYLEKTTDLSQVTDKLHHIMYLIHLTMGQKDNKFMLKASIIDIDD